MTSGKHRGPRYLLTLESAAQRERWEARAAECGLTLAAWIRWVCDSACVMGPMKGKPTERRKKR